MSTKARKRLYLLLFLAACGHASACSGSDPRDQRYGTDAGLDFEAPPGTGGAQGSGGAGGASADGGQGGGGGESGQGGGGQGGGGTGGDVATGTGGEGGSGLP